ncbi:MAG: extracellular solute-binding protein family 5 [Chloroflexi bacterium]|nr:extracellular solute-binding protein family 5 [Chloroflexota bacterium]
MGGRVLLLFAALLSLATVSLIGSEDRPSAGGLYREALVGQPLSINPLLHPNDPVGNDVGRLVHAGLVRVVDGGRIEGDLATGWTTSDNGLTYSFQLKQGALWHDGRPVTSADVAATIAIVQAPGFAGPAELGTLWRRVSAETPDDRTIRLRLSEPYSSFIEACSLPILPQHLFPSADGSMLDNVASYEPVGAGPYAVQSVDAERIWLVRSQGYAGQRPLLDGIELRFYPDAAAALEALLDGEVDGFAGLTAAEAASIPPSRQLEIRQAPLQEQQTTLLLNQRSPILAEQAVRRAIAMRLDRASLVDAAPSAVPAYGPIPAFSWAYSGTEVERQPDPAAAARTLDEAGWVGAPVRSRNGRLLRLEIAVAAEPSQIALAEAISAQLASIGLRADVHPVQPLDLYRERLIPRRYDMALTGVWLGTIDPDPYWLWHSSQADTGLNFAAYRNPLADQMIQQSRSDGDPGRRFAALSAFQRVWSEDVPSMVIASPLLTYATTATLHGVRLGVVPEPSARFQHLAEWYVRTERVMTFGR